MHSISSAVKQSPVSAAWFGDDDEAVAEFSFLLLDGDQVELIATIHQTDKASGRTYSFTLTDKIVEREYAEDDACDVEYDARNFLRQLGVVGTRTGKFSETVAAAIDRAAIGYAVAAE
jgi:hypothetical protein